MKNQVLAIFFYTLYLLAMVKPIMPLLEYYANYDYIVTVLCENRDKPALECNGKCYLQSQIKKIDFKNSHNHNSSEPLISLEDYPVSPIDKFSYKITDLKEINTQSFSSLKITSKGVNNTLFKPPIASA